MEGILEVPVVSFLFALYPLFLLIHALVLEFRIDSGNRVFVSQSIIFDINFL